MNRRQIALKLVLNELGLTPTMSQFDERLILQKAVYLVQGRGITLGYPYSWYLRGPYSRELTADAFANLNEEVPSGWVLDASMKVKLAGVKQLLDGVRAKPNSARELEKLASVLFILKTGQAKDNPTITARLRAAGKDFSLGEVDDAVRALRDEWSLLEN